MKKAFEKYLDTPPFTEDVYRPRFLVDADSLYYKVTGGRAGRKLALQTKVRSLQERNDRQWGIAEEAWKTLFNQETQLLEPEVAALVEQSQSALAAAWKAKRDSYNMFLRIGKKGSRNPAGNVYETLRCRYHRMGKSFRARYTLLFFCERWLLLFWKLQGRSLTDKQIKGLVDLLENQQKNIHKVTRRRAIVQHRISEAEKIS